jgi:bacteriocin-like protein
MNNNYLGENKMNFSAQQIQNVQNEQPTNELLIDEALIENELSEDDLKAIVGGAIEADLGGAGLEV